MPKPLVTIREKSWIARLAAWKLGVDAVALTLGDTIHLHKASVAMLVRDDAWLRHELKHVEQFRRYGFFRFLLMYVWESLNTGYHLNRFEIEARAAEGRSPALQGKPFHVPECQAVTIAAFHE
jgi:hypothetical protein